MRLRVEYRADDVEDNVKWNPENFHIWLNGMELDLVAELQLVMVNGENPVASLTFTPDEIDIDADTISALRALLDSSEAVDDELAEKSE